MATSSTAISKQQAQGYLAAWLGWGFDGLDSFLYTLVAVPFVTQLMGHAAPDPETKGKAALIQAFFLFGWALGGLVFGRVGDKIGRAKTLTLTILIYALFTGLSSFAQEWWHLLIFRFIAALGIGGEWAAGSSLIAETFKNRHHAWASALLQTGYQVGNIVAGLTVAFLPQVLLNLGWIHQASEAYRWVFIIGVTPAFITIWIRKSIPEPETWNEARKNQEMPPITALFSKEVLPITLKVLCVTMVAVTTVWTFIFFNPIVIRATAEAKAMAPKDLDSFIGKFTIIYLLWNIAGNFTASYLARAIGTRPVFVLYMVCGALASYFGFWEPHSLPVTLFWINFFAFFGLGIFALFPMYLPPLFPTLLRTTGAGLCYNFGRVVAGVGTFVTSLFLKEPGKPITYVAALYLLGIVAIMALPNKANWGRDEELAAQAA
jgi:predicted MFS family arabinose efflux permease